ncbi:MAG: dTDP-glucose 4,6-dehydratase [Verrucomicrobia bacterium]|nr:dTDP-glucose 4,6-dehydratase [Verrucomicrobiota bacterium]
MSESLDTRRIMVTGGAGFIGSHLVKKLLNEGHSVLNVDSLTYAGNLSSLAGFVDHPEYRFLQVDVCEEGKITQAISHFQPDWIFHLAAETHVDRSIGGPMEFFRSNVTGTVSLLRGATSYWESLSDAKKAGFRFIHTSTDEVFGSAHVGCRFNETSAYAPGSPYSASKAASDHAVRAWGNTYGLPVAVTNCSNNYGSFQFPEKLIPVVITNALRGNPIPVYGQGLQVRDWLHVYDHCQALVLIAQKGKIGDTYIIAGNDEWRNIDVVELVCGILEKRMGSRPEIEFVADRKGHDFRYSLDSSKIRNELGWSPLRSSKDGFEETVAWYFENRNWWESILMKNSGKV